MTVSVYESALGNYNSRPVWEWSISGFDEVKSLSVYLNNIEQTPTLSPDTRFYRPAKDLAAGQYTLTVKVEPTIPLISYSRRIAGSIFRLSPIRNQLLVWQNK